MADYYPLLARAVTGLQTSTPEARQAIYDRARGALLGQLRGIQPPLPEQDIERESDALQAAVQRLEDELSVAAAAEARRARKGRSRTAPLGDAGGDSDDGRPEGRGEDRRPEVQQTRGPRPNRPGRQRIEPTHPAAPAPPIQRESKARFWIVGFTIAAIVAIIGVTAYFMRDRPEDLAKPLASPRPADASTGTSKIAARADTDMRAAATSPLPSVSVAVVPIPVPPPSETVAATGTSKSAAAPANAPATPGAATSKSPAAAPAAPVATPAAPAPAVPARSNPPPQTPTTAAPAAAPVLPPPEVPVTYRAALLVQAPETAEKVKTFVGTVVWRTENVPGEAGQPLQTAVAADLDIPDAKFKVSMMLQKNTDAALSASHTMTFRFIMAPDGAITSVRSIGMPQMRADGAPSGDDLIGIGIVPITPTYYLVGLKQDPAAIQHNFELIESRNWIDLRFALEDGKAAKITFEKGAQGGKIIAAAAEIWK